MTLGKRLEKLLIYFIENKLAVNKQDFCLKLGIDSTSLSKYLSDKFKFSINESNIANFSHYKIDLNWLLTGEGEMFISGSKAADADVLVCGGTTRYDFYDRLKMFYNESFDSIEKKLNLSTGYISKARSGKIASPDKILYELKKRGLNSDYFLTGEGEATSEKKDKIPASSSMNNIIIPFLKQKASAGSGCELIDTDISCSFIRVPISLTRYGDLKALEIRGDSMLPTLHEGDIIACDTGGWDGDGIYVIKTTEKEFVKRVLFTSKGYQIISDNVLYPAYFELPEELNLVGKVRCAVIAR